MRASFFSEFTKHGMIVSYRRFGTTSRSSRAKSACPLKNGPIDVPETCITTNLRGVKSQKSEDLVKISLCDRL